MNLRLLSAMLVALLPASLVGAGTPDLLPWQGRLLDAYGMPVTAPTTLRFRIYLGGDDLAVPSSGLIVYDETSLIQPDSDGIFSHLIGSGLPAAGCPEGTCAISPDDFGDGATPLWIETTVDPDGIAGTQDDDILLPRTRIGSVGYAYRVASIEGASGGVVSGDLAADNISAGRGLTLGDGSDSDIDITFSRGPGLDATFRWDESAGGFQFSNDTYHAGAIVSRDQSGIRWDTSYDPCLGGGDPCVPVGTANDSSIWIWKRTDTFSSVQKDHVLGWSYNYDPATGSKVSPGEYLFKQQSEYSYWDGVQNLVEFNWDYIDDSGGIVWRPYYFILKTRGIGGIPTHSAQFQMRTCATCETLRMRAWDYDGTPDDNAGIIPAIEMGMFTGSNTSILSITDRVGPNNSSSRYATKSDLILDSTDASQSANEFGGLLGKVTWSSSTVSNSVSSLFGVRGSVQIQGSDPGRSVSQYAAGLVGSATADSTGGATTIPKLLGARLQVLPSGQNLSVSAMAGLLVTSPVSPGTGTTIGSAAAILIEDQKGYGSGNQAAILVYPQTAATGAGSKNNIRMLGGNWNSGHLHLGNAHIWQDATSGVLRSKIGTPVGETDGNALVTGSKSTHFGPLLWAEAGTTCEAACTAMGLACRSAYPSAGGAAVGCQDDTADNNCFCM